MTFVGVDFKTANIINHLLAVNGLSIFKQSDQNTVTTAKSCFSCVHLEILIFCLYFIIIKIMTQWFLTIQH